MTKTLELTKRSEPKTIINQDNVNNLLTVMLINYKCISNSSDINDNLTQQNLIKQYNNIITEIVNKNKGIYIKSVENYKYYYFTGKRDNVNIAIEIQNKIDDYNISRYSETFFLISIVLHTVNRETNIDQNIEGIIDLFSKLRTKADPGEILLTKNTYDLTTIESGVLCKTTTEPSLIKVKNKSYYVYKVLWDKTISEINKCNKEKTTKTFPIYKRFIIMILIPILIFLILFIGGTIPNLFRFSSEKTIRFLENSTTINESLPVVNK